MCPSIAKSESEAAKTVRLSENTELSPAKNPTTPKTRENRALQEPVNYLSNGCCSLESKNGTLYLNNNESTLDYLTTKVK